MTYFVALLRAVNVSGTNKLPMADLRTMAEAMGFEAVRTYIASGNLLFRSGLEEAVLKPQLEARIATHMGKAVPVMIRTAEEIAAIVASNPFPEANGSRHMVYFSDTEPPGSTIADCRDRKEERIALGLREIHVDYAANIRDTRLKLPGMAAMTARNMNTVRALAELMQTPD